MAQEPFLINPPKRLKRKVKADPGFYTWAEVKKRRKRIASVRRRRHNPIGETLTIIGANPSRRNPMASNPWYGNSAGHRRAALIRWGKHPRKVRRSKSKVRRKVQHRKVVHMTRKRRTIDRRTVAYKQSKKKQYSQLKGFLALTAPGPSRRFRYVSGEGWATARRRKNMAKRKRKRNTWFGQPRRHRKAAKKGWRRGHVLATSGGRRRRVRHRNPIGAVSANPKRRSRRHYNVKHRRRHSVRRRRNPFGIGSGTVGQFTGSLMNVRHWAPLAITGGLSAITGAVVPGMLGVYNPWMKYGVQTAVAIGGGMVVEKVAGREHGQAWMIVGVAMVGYSLLKEFVIQPYFPQFAVGLGNYEDYYPVGAYDNADNVSQQVGAFPSQMGAFPSSMNDYPGVGAYPYDGAGY